MSVWAVVGIVVGAWFLLSAVGGVLLGHLIAGRPIRAVAALADAITFDAETTLEPAVELAT